MELGKLLKQISKHAKFMRNSCKIIQIGMFEWFLQMYPTILSIIPSKHVVLSKQHLKGKEKSKESHGELDLTDNVFCSRIVTVKIFEFKK